ncbi:HalOD1 output domain-containing protein [Natronorubrum sp. FCH18a]|uniref:HalOD1 output domain-containing protein n=1 Tax=Natronorubrum sp. FCH18a TaxID=3447018 RepID=UPI003F5127BC
MTTSGETFGSVDIVDSMGAVEFDTERERFRAAYDSIRDSASLAVVAVVATALNSDPMELSPLHSAIDTAALEDLFAPSPGGIRKSGSTSFRYEGFAVTVFSGGAIEAVPMRNRES